ncbi:MAG: phenylalanine--tRNA ligase subunit alpha [Psittacicella sp.]
MLNDLNRIIEQALINIEEVSTLKDIDNLKVELLGKKGSITAFAQNLRNLPNEEKRTMGQVINTEKTKVIISLNKKREALELKEINESLLKDSVDVSLEALSSDFGASHPVNKIIDRISNYFENFGFSKVDGPEIENEYYNFDALNIAKNHPARAEQDTFWLNDNLLLRTQTSGMQIRSMEKLTPPVRIIAPGRVYRNDYDQTHVPMFHQIEILCVDKDITFANLKYILEEFLSYFFDRKVETRFRPSFFPFTEPSAEVDIKDEDGNWLEVLGCGMVHPKVLSNVNIDSNIYSGFAIGMGIERLAMLYYKIKDLRIFFENDMRFLEQFKKTTF